MALPLLAGAGAVLSAVIVRILPWLVALAAGALVAFNDGLRELFFSLLLELVALFFSFIELVFPAGAQTLGDLVNGIPSEATAFLGYMRLSECFVILAHGLAGRLLRKLFLRF